MDVPATEEWRQLSDRFEALRHRHLREFFADDPDRGTRMRVTAADLTLDFSKHRVDDAALSALIDVARRAGVEERRDAMFAGRHINTTEDRAVLHVALRMPRTDASRGRRARRGRRTCTGYSTGWGRWPRPSGRAGGPARPADASPPWSTSASEGPISDRPWPTRPCSTTRHRTSDAGSCPTSTRSTCTTRPTTSTRPRPCS